METPAFENCPHCKTKIKSGILGTVTLYSERAVKLINEYVDEPQLGYCSKCGEDLLQGATTAAQKEIASLSRTIQKLIYNFPIISLQQPFGWDYKVIKIVTAQSTMGTGVFTEIASSFTDMLGQESKKYNEKIKTGEENCFAQLRIQAMQLDANAIIGTDIDYAEMGAGKSMVMVCMTGTAIRLNNPEIIFDQYEEQAKTMKESNSRIAELKKLMME